MYSLVDFLLKNEIITERQVGLIKKRKIGIRDCKFDIGETFKTIYMSNRLFIIIEYVNMFNGLMTKKCFRDCIQYFYDTGNYNIVTFLTFSVKKICDSGYNSCIATIILNQDHDNLVFFYKQGINLDNDEITSAICHCHNKMILEFILDNCRNSSRFFKFTKIISNNDYDTLLEFIFDKYGNNFVNDIDFVNNILSYIGKRSVANIQLINLITKKYNLPKKIFRDLLIDACLQNNIIMIRYLIAEKRKMINSRVINNILSHFVETRFFEIEIFDLLIEKYNLSSENINNLLTMVCEYNRSEFIKYILVKYKNKINVVTINKILSNHIIIDNTIITLLNNFKNQCCDH